MDEKKLKKIKELERWKQKLSIDQLSKNFKALSSWLDKDVDNLKQKHQNFQTLIVQGEGLQELFQKSKNVIESLNLPLDQVQYFLHLLELLLWFFHLNICSTVAEIFTKNAGHSEIFTEISNHLFGNFIILRDNLIGLLNIRFQSFNGSYANILIYSVVKNFLSFYQTYCTWFESELLPVKHKESGWNVNINLNLGSKWPFFSYKWAQTENIPNKQYKFLSEWEKIGRFLKVLKNLTNHQYNKKSSQKINLKEFDPLLEIDYRENAAYHLKIGNKVHKYPLATLVLFRFLLKDQDTSFDDINQMWFSCNGRFFDQQGNIKNL